MKWCVNIKLRCSDKHDVYTLLRIHPTRRIAIWPICGFSQTIISLENIMQEEKNWRWMKLVDKNATGTPPPVHVPDTALRHNGARRNDNLSTSFCLGETIIYVVRQCDPLPTLYRLLPRIDTGQSLSFYGVPDSLGLRWLRMLLLNIYNNNTDHIGYGT